MVRGTRRLSRHADAARLWRGRSRLWRREPLSFFAQESLGPGVYPPIFGAGSFSDTRVGWTAGGGVEWLFLPGWSAKIEYLHYDLGTVTTPTSFLVQTSGGLLWGGAVSTTSARFNGHIVRVGLNYHFDLFSPATPVIAKY